MTAFFVTALFLLLFVLFFSQKSCYNVRKGQRFPVICYYYDVNPLAVQAETQETEPTESTVGEAEGM